MNILEQLQTQMAIMQQKMREAQQFMEDNGRQYIEAAVSQFFEACPEVTCIFWNQYTPYFNDGEPCEFSVHDIYYNIEGIEDPDGEGAYLYTERDYERAIKALEDVKQFEADPAAWRATFRADYLARFGREYYARDDQIFPYPRTVEAAQEAVDEIKAQRTLISLEAAERINAAYETLNGLFRHIPNDTMRAIYGDHVRVIITRNGTEIDEYSHD